MVDPTAITEYKVAAENPAAHGELPSIAPAMPATAPPIVADRTRT